MKDFRDLKVWERSHHLTLDVYRATAGFPREELYGLTSQMRRGSASIAANLAEGCGKRGNNARDLGFLSSTEHDILAKQLGELRRMLTSLIVKVDLEWR